MVDMNRTDEKGMALILVMIMLAVLSVIAASLMAVSTADTASSTNYRLMTVARYGAETVHVGARSTRLHELDATASKPEEQIEE